MPTFVNPDTGNREVWKEKPANYLTEEEWAAAHPYVPEPVPEDQLFMMLRAARNSKLAAYDDKVAQLQRELRMGIDVTAELAAWDAYAQALCDLPAQAGAPWDGGGKDTPWPIAPDNK